MSRFDVDDDLLSPFRALGRGPGTPDLEQQVLAAVSAEDPLAAPSGGQVLMVGDLHGNAGAALGMLHNKAAPAGLGTVVQVGDFGFWGCSDGGRGEGYLDVLSTALLGLGMTLLVVDGNHEDYDMLARFPLVTDGPAAGLRPVRPRIWHLPRGTRWSWPAADGTATTWLAVGGAVSVDAALRTPGVSWWPEEELTDEQADRISASGPVDVVVCHDRPAAAQAALGKQPGEWHARAPAGWAKPDLERSDLHSARVQRVVDAVRPGQVWHGHLHARTEVLIDPTAWGGTCRVHGLAHDDQPGGNTARARCDGSLIR